MLVGFEETLLRAGDALSVPDPGAALALYDAVLADDPEDAEALGGRIRSLWLLRRAGDARQALAAVPARLRGSAPLLVAEGTLALGLRDDLVHAGIRFGTAGRRDADAHAAFAAAAAADPSLVSARRGLATALRLAGRGAEAREALDAAIGELGPRPELLLESAWCAVDDGEQARAEELLDEALAAGPGDVGATLAKSFVLRAARRPDEAYELLQALRAAPADPGPALETEQGWVARSQAGRVRATASDAEADAKWDEARGCFERALAALPHHPSAAFGLAYGRPWGVPAEGERVPEGAAAPEDSAGGSQLPAAARAFQAVRDGAYDLALTLFREARTLDPYPLRGTEGEVFCLRATDRIREARRTAEAALAEHPRDPWILTALGRIESDAGRPERALELFTAAGEIGLEGRVRTLIDLDCPDTAEELAGDALVRRPRDAVLHGLHAVCAYNQGRYAQAVARCDRGLRLDPADAVTLERRKQAERRRSGIWRRLLGLSVPPPDEPGKTRDRAALMADLLPADTPVGLLGGLRAVDRQRAVIGAWADGWLSAVTIWLFVLGMTGYFIGAPFLLDLLGGPFGSWDGTLVVAGAVAAFLGGLWLLVYLPHVSAIPLVVAGSALAVAGLVVVLWRGHGHPGQVALTVVLAASAAPLGWLLLLCIVVFESATRRTRLSRLRRRRPYTHLVCDLLDLAAQLEYEPALRAPDSRQECIDLLERIACGQERVLMELLSRRGIFHATEPTRHAFRQHVAGVAASTRDLKRSVLSPGPATWPALRAKVAELLAATCHARWDDLPYRQPDPVGQVLGKRLLNLLRNLLVLLIPPALLFVLQAAQVFPSELPTEVRVIAYIAWPAIVLLLWVDPALASKINLVKTSVDTLRPGFGQGKGGAGE